MRHIGALALKFIVAALILEIILMSMTNLSFSSILWISLGVTLLSYLIGDLLILPRASNIVATIVDAILAFGVMMFFDAFIFGNIDFIDALVASLGVGVGEYILHKFMGRSVSPTRYRG